MSSLYLPYRPRRNRKSAVIRDLVQENRLAVQDLIFPLFLIEGQNQLIEVASMPGIYRHTLDQALREIEECMQVGLRVFAPFPSIAESKKDKLAQESLNPKGLYLNAIREIKKHFPEACLVTDVALDPYSSDGHDGIVENGEILNDETVDILAQMAVAQAEAGADIVAPSDMMDGRVGAIREALDEADFTQVSIMAYTAKYASAFYGPFRDALNSAPRFGDKKTYQMNPANAAEALREAELDEDEGADFLMVKPAMPYLDIIHRLYEDFHLPIVAYQVSGEYAMIKAAAQNGWIDEERAMVESLMSIKRAGAKVIISYFAKAFAKLQSKS